MAANAMQIPLSIYNVKIAEILEAVENTIKILKNFNDIEIRNNVVMYLAIKKQKRWEKKASSQEMEQMNCLQDIVS